jgi:hypothetical protein
MLREARGGDSAGVATAAPIAPVIHKHAPPASAAMDSVVFDPAWLIGRESQLPSLIMRGGF